MADGRVVTRCDSGTVSVWDRDGGGPPRVLEGRPGSVYAVAVTLDGRIVTASDDGTVRTWDPDSLAPLQVLERHIDEQLDSLLRHYAGQVVSVAVTADGRIVSAGRYGPVRVWDPNSGQPPRVLSFGCDSGGLDAVAVTPDGSLVACSDGHRVSVWDCGSDQPRLVVFDECGFVSAVALTADRRVVTGHLNDGGVRIWALDSDPDQEGCTPLQVMEGHLGWVREIAVAADGSVVSCGSDGTVRVWDPDSGALRATLIGFAEGGWAALRPDGAYQLGGDPAGLWWAAGLCRFEPGELDPYLPHLHRLDPGTPILNDW
jgi:WD40 repeat protein